MIHVKVDRFNVALLNERFYGYREKLLEQLFKLQVIKTEKNNNKCHKYTFTSSLEEITTTM